MKYFYQQLLACLAIVLITITICGGLFYNLTTNNIYNNLSKELFSYAEMIVAKDLDIKKVEQSVNLLADDQIQIAEFDQYNTMIYPKTQYVFKSKLSDAEAAKLVAGEVISMKKVKENFNGQPEELALIYYPVIKNERYEGFIAIGSPLSYLQSEFETLENILLIAFGIASTVGVLISFIFARYQNKRINQLRKATKQIAQGNFDITLPVLAHDEIDELALDFNQMANSLQESEKEIERQEQLRRQLLMDVAHEMRTPLTTMNGLLEGLLHNMIPETKRERSLELISKETQRLTRLVNENLDYEKIQANEIVLVKQDIPVKSTLKNVVLQLQELANKKGDKIEVNCQDDFIIYADYDRFIQIMVNLLKNAIQFTDNGQITVETRETEHYAVISIEDTGMGIDEKEIDSIWERFYKVDNSRKSTKYGESGIGLAIVKSLVTSHGGDIFVNSQKGQGTKFIIKFPKRN